MNKPIKLLNFNMFLGSLLTCVLFFFTSIIPQTKKVCLVETREYPGRDPSMWDGLYVASDGRVYTGLATEGKPHIFLFMILSLIQ
jgi:hypothetical protein